MSSIFDQFKISGKVIVITGGAGLIGRRHTEAVLEGGGIPVLLDIFEESLIKVRDEFLQKYQDATIEIYQTDITKRDLLEKINQDLIDRKSVV